MTPINSQKRTTTKLTSFVAVICLSAILFSGCRNGRPFANGCGGCGGVANNLYGAGTTVPAPGTYTLTIPSLAQNQQPYYNPNATAQQPAYLINPAGRAPTPATSSPTLAPASGWRPVNGNDYSSNTQSPTGTGVAPGNQLAAQSVLVGGPQSGRIPARTASANNNVVSTKDSVNYATTSVDERLDDSRLPATDASTIRPVTTGVSPTALAAVNYNTRPAAATYNPAAQPLAGGYVAAVPVYGTVQYGQNVAVYNGNVQPVAPQYQVAQSTTQYDPYRNANADAGWRSREFK